MMGMRGGRKGNASPSVRAGVVYGRLEAHTYT